MSEGSENTGQISVAELLARNGQQVESRGGRRRRGVAGGISVAELTGEIPVVRDRPEAPEPPPTPEPTPAPAAVETPAKPEAAPEPVTAPEPEAAPKLVTGPKSASAMKFEAALWSGAASESEPTPVREVPPAVAPKLVVAPKSASALKFEAALNSKAASKADASAKPETAALPETAAMPQMRTITPAAPRPVTPAGPAEEDHTQAIPALDKAALAKADAARKSGPAKSGPLATAKAPTAKPAAKAVGNAARTAGAFTPFAGSEPALLSGASPQDEPMRTSGTERTARNESLDDARSQVHTTGEFPRITDAGGGRRSRRGKSADDGAPEAEADTAAADDSAADDDAVDAGSPARQWAVLGGQALVAVVAGGLLFKGFETLWEMLPWVALVLAVLVIAGLVAVVRILRQTDDMVSLLIAVIVGVFVTIGPLAFVLSSS